MDTDYATIIIGSGISGLSAAVYTARGGNSTLVLRGDEPGGQLTLTSEVANYPGFPEPVGGTELVNRIEEQAESFGTEFERGIVSKVEQRPNETYEIQTKSGDKYTARSIIVASGASARTLGIDGEDDLMGYGVSTCATCDGAFFKGEDMAIVGGGDAAFEEAIFLTKFANKVYIIHRREGIRAEKYLQDKVDKLQKEGKIELLTNTEVTKINGSKETGVENIETVTNPDGYPKDKLDDPNTSRGEIDVGALFIAIGHTPNTEFLESTDVKLDERGYIELADHNIYETMTGQKGIFAAGDVFDDHYQQAATAAGSGVKASMDSNDYLENNFD